MPVSVRYKHDELRCGVRGCAGRLGTAVVVTTTDAPVPVAWRPPHGLRRNPASNLYEASSELRWELRQQRLAVSAAQTPPTYLHQPTPLRRFNGQRAKCPACGFVNVIAPPS